jgi:hypothetical protein
MVVCVKIPLINTFASKNVNRPPFEKRGNLREGKFALQTYKQFAKQTRYTSLLIVPPF